MACLTKVLSGAAVALAAMSLPFAVATPAHADTVGRLHYLMERDYDLSPGSDHGEARVMGCSAPYADMCGDLLQAGMVAERDRLIACHS